MDDLLLTIDETAELLRVSPRALYSWRKRAHGPAPTRIGFRKILYRRSDVELYLSAMRDRAINECITTASGKANND